MWLLRVHQLADIYEVKRLLSRGGKALLEEVFANHGESKPDILQAQEDGTLSLIEQQLDRREAAILYDAGDEDFVAIYPQKDFAEGMLTSFKTTKYDE